MEIIGRDKITQTGDNSVVKIKNTEQKERWYQTGWGQIVIFLIGTFLVYSLGWNK
jgi:hypothetical protein